MDVKDRPLTTDEAAEYLNIARHTLIRAAKEGKVVCRKVGKFYYFKPSDLMAYFDSLPTLNKKVAG